MNPSDLENRLMRIERRISRIETALDLLPEDETQDTLQPSGQAPVFPLPSQETIQHEDNEPLVTKLLRSQVSQRDEPLESDLSGDETGSSHAFASSSSINYEPIPAPRTQAPVNHAALEQTIGLKWAGWVGAIILVIGAGLGIKFAYDQGWFGGLPPTFRLVLMCLGGFGLIATGEVVYLRINKLSATGLFGAGVAVLFIVSYAGHAYYQLYERETAFAFMAIATLVGAGVSMRGKLVSIAVLSLVGGNLAPVLLQGSQPQVVGFLLYLLTLQLVALTLSWWGNSPKWWTLRGLSLVSTSLWVAGVLGTQRFDAASATLVFILLYAVLFHAELILTAIKGERTQRTNRAGENAGVLFAMIVTALTSLATLYFFRESTAVVRTLWVIGFATAAGALAVVLARKEGIAALRALADGYVIQAFALVAAAVPVAFDGASLTIGWGILAIAFAILGSYRNVTIARFASLVTWGLAVINLLMWVGDGENLKIISFHLPSIGTPILTAALLGWSLSLAGHVCGWLAKRKVTENSSASSTIPGLATMIAVLASVLWGIAAVVTLPPLGATSWLLVLAWGLAIADRLLIAGPGWGPQSIVLIAVAAVKWVVVDTLAARLAPGWQPSNTLPIFNPLMGTGLLVAASIAGIYAFRKSAILKSLGEVQVPESKTSRFSIVAAVVVLICIGLSFEIDRVVENAVAIGSALTWSVWQLKQMAWTVLWSIAGASMTAFVARAEPRSASRLAWLAGLRVLIAVFAVKFVLIDSLMYAMLFPSVIGATAVMNLQLFTAVVLAGAMLFAHAMVVRETTTRDGGATILASTLTSFVGLATAFILLWAGTMEIDRLAHRFASVGTFTWPVPHLKQLAFTAWWMFGFNVYFLILARLDRGDPARRAAWVASFWKLPAAVAIKYLTCDTLLAAVWGAPTVAPVLANPAALTAAFVLGGMMLLWYFAAPARSNPLLRQANASAIALAVLTLLWAGTIEIDHAFAGMAGGGLFGDPRRAKQVAVSIYWAMFAVAAVVAGFRFRAAELRYFGLGLLTVALLKVVFLDLRTVGTGYRILSFLGLGLLMLGTSVVYGKLSPVLLHEPDADGTMK